MPVIEITIEAERLRHLFKTKREASPPAGRNN